MSVGDGEAPPQGRPFLCREWALEQLQQRVCAGAGGVLLTGGAGAGKTALCVEALWPQTEGGRRAALASRCVAAHFCTRDDEDSLCVWRFVLSVVQQLRDTLTPAYSQALQQPHVSHLLQPEKCQRDPHLTFKRAVVKLLLDLPAPAHNVFMLVDGLDAGVDGPLGARWSAGIHGSIAELLSCHQQLLPGWMLLVCSARRQCKTVCKSFSAFEKLPLDDLRKPAVVRDVQQYILRRLEQEEELRRHLTPDTAEMLNLLHIKSGGCFLFLERTLDGVAKGLLALREIRDVPGTLNGLYLWLCQRLFPRKLFWRVRHLLSVLLASLKPLTPEQLYRAAWTRDTSLSYAQFLRRLDTLIPVLVDGPGGTRLLFHSSFAEWLTDVKYCTQKFLCSPAEGHATLAMSLTLQGVELDSQGVYQLANHLLHSGIHAEDHSLLALWMVWADIPPLTGSAAHLPELTYQPEVPKLLVQAGLLPSLPNTIQEQQQNKLAHKVFNSQVASLNGLSDVQEQLLNASCHGSSDMVQTLLSFGADPMLSDPQKQTPLTVAARQGHVKVLEVLLNWALHQSVEGTAMVDHADGEGWTALRAAAWGGHTEAVRLLLDAGAEVDGCDGDGRTALRAAAWAGHEEILLTLLDKGAWVDKPDREGRTPLIAAAYMGHREAVQILLDAGAVVDLADGDGRTALSVAAAGAYSGPGNGCGEVMSLLMERGADPAHRDRDGMTALLLAAFEGRSEAAELLLEIGADVDESVDARSSGGVTPLLAAATAGHVAVVRVALFWGASVDAIDGEGRTALSLAAARGSVDVVRALLERGLDENHKDDLGWTPLHAAACEGHRGVCAVLTEDGSMARVGEPDNDGRTPLILAAQEGHYSTVRLLLDRRAPIDHRSYEGHSALSAATLQGHREVVELLMRRGADTDVRDAEGRPLLYLLVLEGRLDMASLLVEKGGVPLESRDSEGRTALHVATWRDDLETMTLLLKHGADPNAQDREGRPPLHSAAWRGHTAAACLLLGAGGATVDLSCRQQGATALCIAAQEGHMDLVALLLERGADPDHKDLHSRSPVKVAGKSGHVDIVRLLESNGAKPFTGPLLSPPSTLNTTTMRTQSSTSSRSMKEGGPRMLQASMASVSHSPGSTAEKFNSMKSSQTSSSTCNSLATVQTVPADSLSFTQQIQQHSLPRGRSRQFVSPSSASNSLKLLPKESPPNPEKMASKHPFLPAMNTSPSSNWDYYLKPRSPPLKTSGLEQDERLQGSTIISGNRWNSVMASLGITARQDRLTKAVHIADSPPPAYLVQLEKTCHQELDWRQEKMPPSVPTNLLGIPPEGFVALASTDPQLHFKQAIKLQFEGPTSMLVLKKETPL